MQLFLQTKGWWSEKIPNYCDRIIFSRHKFSVCQTPELLGLFPLSTTQRSGCLRPLWPHCSCPDWPEYSHDFGQSWVFTWFWTILAQHGVHLADAFAPVLAKHNCPPSRMATRVLGLTFWHFSVSQSNCFLLIWLNHLGSEGRLVDGASCDLNRRRRICLEGWDTMLMLVQRLSPIFITSVFVQDCLSQGSSLLTGRYCSPSSPSSNT